jgi:large subunit ribosomal protein L13
MEFTKKDLNQTLRPKPQALSAKRKRVKIDATGKTLGRLAVEISNHLIGKNNSYYCDFWDTGASVVVDNVDKLTFTGSKAAQKSYYTYSGYKGNVKEKTLGVLFAKDPSKVLRYAVRGMLPKNKLRDPRMKRLKMFVGEGSAKYNHLLSQSA